MGPQAFSHHSGSQGLTIRPGTHNGWAAMDNVTGDLRCRTIGHEIEDLLHMAHGVLVGYCVRCSARFEAPWVRGGTAVPLAQSMVEEALGLDEPAASVLTDLEQISALLEDDAEALITTLNAVTAAMKVVREKVP
jgi:hypothetical protein